jgi:hypothetical protein
MPFFFLGFLGDGVDGRTAMVVFDGWCDMRMK